MCLLGFIIICFFLSRKTLEKRTATKNFFAPMVSTSEGFHQPSEKETPRKTPNRLMASTSSHEEAAITSVGIPASTPYPLICKFSMDGTTTAGETAPKMKLLYKINSKIVVTVNERSERSFLMEIRIFTYEFVTRRSQVEIPLRNKICKCH